VPERTRVVDPSDRELTISRGAALYHLRLALRHFGWATRVAWAPAATPDLLASVWLSGRHTPRLQLVAATAHPAPRRTDGSGDATPADGRCHSPGGLTSRTNARASAAAAGTAARTAGESCGRWWVAVAIPMPTSWMHHRCSEPRESARASAIA
jgi:hypothetical protein